MSVEIEWERGGRKEKEVVIRKRVKQRERERE